MSLISFSNFEGFKRVYGEEPHLNCFIIGCEKEVADSWSLTMIIDQIEIRDVRVAMASKRQLSVWCRKSQKILRYKMRQIIGDRQCLI